MEVTPAKVAGFGDKVLGVVDKFSPVLGTAAGWVTKPLAVGGGAEGAVDYVWDSISHFKIANPLITTKIALTEPDNYPIIHGAIMAIGGMVGEELGESFNSSTVTKGSRAVKKFGAAAFTNSLIAAYVYEAKNNPNEGGRDFAGSPQLGTKARVKTRASLDNPQHTLMKGTAGSGRFAWQ